MTCCSYITVLLPTAKANKAEYRMKHISYFGRLETVPKTFAADNTIGFAVDCLRSSDSSEIVAALVAAATTAVVIVSTTATD